MFGDHLTGYHGTRMDGLALGEEVGFLLPLSL